MRTKTIAASAMAFTLCLGAVLMPGCATKQEDIEVISVERPHGSNPIPPAGEPVVIETDEQRAQNSAPAVRAVAEDVAADFKKEYAGAGEPKIAVLVNRTLSGEVREWKSNTRIIIGHGGTASRTREDDKKGNRTEMAQVREGVSSSVEVRADDGAGKYLEEDWAWRLEDAVMNSLMDAGAHVVDRELVMRLAAAEIGHTAHEDLPIKTIEMNALKGKADILAEIQISRDKDPRKGYVFRVQAYRIETGERLVAKNSMGWPRSRSTRGELIITDTGYERADYPKPENVGLWLAEDLMQGLAKRL